MIICFFLSYYALLNSEKVVVIGHNYLLFSLNCLKYHVHNQYKLLSCISGVDLIECSYRFCVVFAIPVFIPSTEFLVNELIHPIVDNLGHQAYDLIYPPISLDLSSIFLVITSCNFLLSIEVKSGEDPFDPEV